MPARVCLYKADDPPDRKDKDQARYDICQQHRLEIEAMFMGKPRHKGKCGNDG